MTISETDRDNIATQRATLSQTRRPTVPAMEEILFSPIPVLDHGFVRVVDYMGNDEAIVQAARVSYGTGTKTAKNDEGLINYLLSHRHTTPFEMCEIKFHVKLPVFVARQWVRHRTANINEYSARYSILDKEFYIPKPGHLAAQSSTNKQGRGDVLTGEDAERVLKLLEDDNQIAYAHYEFMLNERDGDVIRKNSSGLSRELARMNLPLSIYTQWYWKVDLHNLMHFLSLRADPHAQLEIRLYADEMVKIVQQWVPHTYAAFENHVLNSVHLSGKALDVVQKMLAGEVVSEETSGLNKREWRELQETFNL